MAYTPTTFTDRAVQNPGRRLLTPVSGQANTYDVTRAEGTVFAVGTKPDAANLNAEFTKIATSINNAGKIATFSFTSIGTTNTTFTTVTSQSFVQNDTTSLKILEAGNYIVSVNGLWVANSAFGRQVKLNINGTTKAYVVNQAIPATGGDYTGVGMNLGMFKASALSVNDLIVLLANGAMSSITSGTIEIIKLA